MGFTRISSTPKSANYKVVAGSSITNNAAINFDTQVNNSLINSVVTTGSGWRVTATTAQKYNISVMLTQNSGNNIFAIYKNGSYFKQICVTIPNTASNVTGFPGSAEIDLAATEFFDIRPVGASGTLTANNFIGAIGDSNYIDITEYQM